MAKKNETATVNFVYGDLSVDSRDLSPEVILGLAGLGFTTKLKNATAGLKPAILGKTKDGAGDWTRKEVEAAMTESKFDENNYPSFDAALPAFADYYADWTVRMMFESIIDGTVSFGSARGPRLRGIDHYVAEVARGLWAKVKAKVSGLTKENEKEKFAAFMAANREKFLPEAQRRMDEDKALEDMDVTI